MTYATLLTSRAVAAIAVIQLTGDTAAAAVGGICQSPRARTLAPGEILHTRLLDGDEVVDDALVIRIAPDRFELHLHGGLAVIDAVLATVQRAGAQVISLDQARDAHLLSSGNALEDELLHAMPRAGTLTGARLLAAQRTAGLAAWTRHWQAWLQTAAPAGLWRLHSAAQWLLLRSRALAALLDPPRIAIIGPPNAGKSTLANALLGRPVSITSDLAGTTRDWVDALARFTTTSQRNTLDVPVTLVDTAGIRDTPDPLEQQSIHRTHEQARAADLLILLLDATRLPSDDELTLLDAYPEQPVILAVNKIDALPQGTTLAPRFTDALPVSARHRAGLDTLMHAVLAHLDLHAIGESEPFAFTSRQRDLLSHLTLTPTLASAAALLDSLLSGQAARV